MFRRFGYAQRVFQKGDFKYLILDLLKDKPRYGYEIIRALEERFHGFYAPSPGIVYPTLQMLEEMGYVTSSQQEAKRIYTITDAGRSFLAEREKTTEEAKSRMEKWSPEIRAKLHQTMRQLWEIGKLIGRQAYGMDPEKLEKVQQIISQASNDVQAILGQE